MKIIAHRGNKHVTPENTMAAFEAAARAGAHMIETDIYPCKTGEIVIMHDDDISHTTYGTGKITELSFAEVEQLDVGVKFAPAFAGQKVPTLEDLIGFYQKYPELELLLEFKGLWNESDARRVTEALFAANLQNRVIVESFHPETVRALSVVAPQLNRGLLIADDTIEQINENYGDPIELAQELNAMCINPSVELITENPDLVANIHAAGMDTLVWTANEPALWERLLALGVAAACTDRPEFLAGWLAGRGC